VDGPILLMLNESSLIAAGVDNALHRARLLSGIAVLRMGLSDTKRAALPPLCAPSAAAAHRKRKPEGAEGEGPSAKRARSEAGTVSANVEMAAADS
jgi:hypothetical protein